MDVGTCQVESAEGFGQGFEIAPDGVVTCQVESAEGFGQGFEIAPDGVVDPLRVEGELFAGEALVVDAAVKGVVRPKQLLQLCHFLPIPSAIID